MNTEALAKHAIKSIISSSQSSKEKERQEERERERLVLEQQEAKLRWWQRTKPTDSVLSIEERRILKKVKSRAHFLDRGVSLCCFQIGFDGIIGFVPVVGDFIGLFLALKLVHTCMEANIPNDLLTRMLINVAFDFMIGLIPVVGDVMDIMYKCNTKNAILFEDHLYKRNKHKMKHSKPNSSNQHYKKPIK